VEHLDKDVVVQNFDTDVSVKTSSDERGDHGENVTGGLDIVGGDTEVGRVDDVLALVTVEEETVEHVDDVDEDLGCPHAFQEVAGTAGF